MNDMIVLWKGMKSIVNLKSSNLSAVLQLLDKNGSETKDPVQIANQFNNFFTSDDEDITKKIQGNPRSP